MSDEIQPMTTCPQCGEAVGIDGLCDQCELAAKEERKRNESLAESNGVCKSCRYPLDDRSLNAGEHSLCNEL